MPFRRGFHAWAEPPAHESGLCAWMGAGESGRWGAGECAAPRAVVCCAPPPPPPAFECSRGVAEESSTWPLVPFYYRDTPLDDIPNTEAEIAEGFSNSNAYFVGNAALAELDIDEAELCVEDLAAEKKLCLPLDHRESELLYDGGVREALRGESVTSLHTLIGILSGQAAVPAATEELIWDMQHIVGPMLSTNAKMCVQPQATAFGTPLHCWATALDDVPFHCLGKIDQNIQQSYNVNKLHATS